MNIHHLELFYYVARHGGISRAVRNMPYGIQQPAVSSQILLLEEDLGTKLFERSPFKLTAAGVELFAFAEPFFGNLEGTAQKLRQQAVPHLRIGASELVLRDYLPEVIGRLREQEPRLRLTLRSGFQDDLERWLLDREDSPWYPTARLFRQDDTRTWDGVIPHVRAALQDFVRGR